MEVKEEDEVERGWVAETVSRANGIVSQRTYALPRTSCVPVKMHRAASEERKRTNEKGDAHCRDERRRRRGIGTSRY